MFNGLGVMVRLFAVAAVLSLLAAPAVAADGSAAWGDAEAGFVKIFNGKDLTGWEGDPRFWSVAEGAIRGETTEEQKTKSNTFLVWRDGKLKNFVLKTKFRLRNHNSGIQYRSKEVSEWVMAGYQGDILDNRLELLGFLYEEKARGFMTVVGDIMEVNPTDDPKVKSGIKKEVVGKICDAKQLTASPEFYKKQDWNDFTIIARGNHIVHYVNGHQTMELIDNDPQGRAMEGLLALQLHAGPAMRIEFKDVLVKHLPERFGEAVRLFDGKATTGWAFSDEAQQGAWSVKDGALETAGKPRGYILTEKDYTNYILRVQLRHLTKGNCGVLVRAVAPFKVWPKSIECQGAKENMGDIWNIDEFAMKADVERTTGRRTLKMQPSNEKPVGEWNQYEITLDGGDLEIKVNDQVQNTATDCEELAGRICFQSEGANVQYRNVVLIPLER